MAGVANPVGAWRVFRFIIFNRVVNWVMTSLIILFLFALHAIKESIGIPNSFSLKRIVIGESPLRARLLFNQPN